MSARTVVIAGGGAAGFFAAIACARRNPQAQVLLCESGAQLLAKVRISGGGRCNVTHACFEPRELVKHYPRGGRELLGAFHRWQPRDTIEWFAAEGVELKTESDGRMFPVTDDSATIVECLTNAARAAGVEVRNRTGVTKVERIDPGAGSSDGARLRVGLSDGVSLDCHGLLLATGGGRAGAGLSLAGNLGHAIEPPVPSLFTFHVPDPRLAGLAGVSIEQAEVLWPDAPRGSPAGVPRSGPLLVTHVGLSGPGVLRLSAWAARELAAVDYRFRLRVNFVPGRSRSQVEANLRAVRAANLRKQIGTFSPIEVPLRLWTRLAGAAGLTENQVWSGISNDAIARLADQIGAAEFQVNGKTMNKEEFVTCGGVRLSEVDFRTMESRLVPGLHFAGEILDIDGVTGGFNFQSAWTTGWLAGESLAACAVEN